LLASGERYRVEVLVMMHLDHSEQAREVGRIRDYSGALDFLAPPEEEPALPEGCEPEEEEETEPAPVPEETGESALLDGESEEPVEEIDPNAVIHVEGMGPEMQDAWRRLRLSGPFRPLQYLSWEQGSEAPFPSLRVHGDEVVFIDDPWADLREAEDEVLAIYGDTAAVEPGIASPDCAPATADPLPPPNLYYALDGTASLIRTRFLHLKLDLQLREGVEETASQQPLGTVHSSSGPSKFLVHGLEQSRQVRSGRMEYFDGPVIGVLAWIMSIPLAEAGER
jgi:hypothetical protein